MTLDKRNLYRFPWSMNDNPIAWLEITDICNIHCEGCYRQHMTGHKPLEQVKGEILFFKRWRNPDNVSIAGGEPLIHPPRLFESLCVQSIGIIQAPDFLPDGRADMCDSCPDMTVYDGKLINSCRMDEYWLLGGFLSVTARRQEEPLTESAR